jgi:hypothetical protein
MIIAIIASFFREKRLSFGVIFSRKTKRNDYHYQPYNQVTVPLICSTVVQILTFESAQ